MMIAETIVSPTLSGTDADDTVYIPNGTGQRMVIEAVTLMPAVSVAAHASNIITTTVSTAGGTVGTHSTDTDVAGYSAMTAGTPIAMSISGSGLALEVAAGAGITVAVTKGGTGPAYEFAACVRWRAAR